MPLTHQAEQFLAAIAESDRPPWDALTPPQAREAFEALADLAGPIEELSRVEDRTIGGAIPIRIYCDRVDQVPPPAVMYFHGGGWVLGSIHSHDAVCRRIAKESGCCVISVDYRLAPEHPYPIPLDDCYGATRHVVDHASDFGIDPNRIALVGDSAGGNLAAAVSLKARDEGSLDIRLQILIYPVIERDFETPSYQQCAEGHGLSLADMRWFWNHYVGDRIPDHYAAPARATSHAGIAPAHVITAEYDVLRDEGEQYARQLAAAGIAVTSKRYDGNLHGFVQLAGAFDDGLAATRDLSEILKSQLDV